MKFQLTLPVEIEYALTPAEAGEREVGTGLMLSPNVPAGCDIVRITHQCGVVSGMTINPDKLDAEVWLDIIDACFADAEKASQ